jgi:hypothetical protein
VGRKKSTIIFCDASGASDLELKYDRLSVRSFLTRAALIRKKTRTWMSLIEIICW